MNRRNFIIGAVSIPAAILTAKYFPTFESKWYDGLEDGLWGQLMIKGHPIGRPQRFSANAAGGPLVYMNTEYRGPPITFDEMRLWSSNVGELCTVKDFNCGTLCDRGTLSIIGRIV